jgi:hypothetical protein
MIHYFLCRQADNYLRIGIEGNQCKAEEFFSGSKGFDCVEYIGEFADVVYTDVDEWNGVGNRRFDGFAIRTCKYIYQLRTKHDDGDYFKYLKEAHVRLQASVEEAWKRKNARKAKKAEEAKVC